MYRKKEFQYKRDINWTFIFPLWPIWFSKPLGGLTKIVNLGVYGDFSLWDFVSDHRKCVTSSSPALTLTHTSHPVVCSCWLPLEPLPQCDLSQGAVLTSPSSLSSVFLICAGTDSVLYLFLVTTFHENALLILSQRTLFHITVFNAFIENLLDIL